MRVGTKISLRVNFLDGVIDRHAFVVSGNKSRKSMTLRSLSRTQRRWSRSTSPREAFLMRVDMKISLKIKSFDEVVGRHAFVVSDKQSDESMTLGFLSITLDHTS